VVVVVTVSGSGSPLTQRLVDVAARAISKAEDVPPEVFFAGDIYRTTGAAAAIAVLRELVEALEAERRDYASITRLTALADSIEKGE
jgi:ribosomal protein L18E